MLSLKHVIGWLFSWTAVWATIIFVLNGAYELEYMTWYMIIWGCVAAFPWCLLDWDECERKYGDGK